MPLRADCRRNMPTINQTDVRHFEMPKLKHEEEKARAERMCKIDHYTIRSNRITFMMEYLHV